MPSLKRRTRLVIRRATCGCPSWPKFARWVCIICIVNLNRPESVCRVTLHGQSTCFHWMALIAMRSFCQSAFPSLLPTSWPWSLCETCFVCDCGALPVPLLSVNIENLLYWNTTGRPPFYGDHFHDWTNSEWDSTTKILCLLQSEGTRNTRDGRLNIKLFEFNI